MAQYHEYGSFNERALLKGIMWWSSLRNTHALAYILQAAVWLICVIKGITALFWRIEQMRIEFHCKFAAMDLSFNLFGESGGLRCFIPVSLNPFDYRQWRRGLVIPLKPFIFQENILVLQVESASEHDEEWTWHIPYQKKVFEYSQKNQVAENIRLVPKLLHGK